MKRYFIVTYTYKADSNTEKITGNGQVNVESNGFINQKETEKDIIKQLKKEYNYLRFINVVIQNIIELSEKDCNNWLGINTEQEEDWDEIIKNMMFDINYHSKYFITANETVGYGSENILTYNLFNKKNKHIFYEKIATQRTLEELKEILKKKYYE